MKAAKMKSPQARWTRDREKEGYWRKQVALWQESGLSVRAFCKEHGVIETSFYAWRRELIVRARESGSIEEISAAQNVPPNNVTRSVTLLDPNRLSLRANLDCAFCRTLDSCASRANR